MNQLWYYWLLDVSVQTVSSTTKQYLLQHLFGEVSWEKYPPAPLCSYTVCSAADNMSWWLSFGRALLSPPTCLISLPCPCCHLPGAALESVQQHGELVSLLLTRQSPQLQVFSLFVPLPGYKICYTNRREKVIQAEE